MLTEEFSIKSRETAINVVQTAVDSIRKKDIVRTGLRVYENGLIGVAGAIGAFDRARLIARAREALSLQIAYPYEPSANRRQEMACPADLIPENELVEEIEEILFFLRKEQPGFTFFNKVKIIHNEARLFNDRDLHLAYTSSHIEVELVFKEKASRNIVDGFIGYAGRKYERNEFLRLAQEICEAYKNPLDLPAEKKYPVIFLGSEELPLKKFALELNGLKFGAGSSLLADRKEQAVFNPRFTLAQTLHPDDGFSPFFDAEGVVNPDYRYPLIKEGVVAGPYTDKRTAALFNLPLTGSATAEFDATPTLGMTGFNIEESGASLKELLGGEKAIFVMVAMGGDFTPQGDFASPVQLALYFDGERFNGRLPQIQISGNLFTMFNEAYIGVSKDPYTSLSNDRCLVLELSASKI
jgi:PmbA protein